MAMKVINKKDVIEKDYVTHTILEKDIMTTVLSNFIFFFFFILFIKYFRFLLILLLLICIMHFKLVTVFILLWNIFQVYIL